MKIVGQCSNCANWDREPYLEWISKRDVRYPDGGYGVCAVMPRFEAMPWMTSMVLDKSGASASVLTTPDFGCIRFEAKR